ncbi:uncharacterized protein [Drosophila kikkawai]|uniref:Uncharacterized protein n=1 Tax=Drosophila kikkawai TaxID=30033 RepID=A0A6P4IN86_DROKI|nr:uncharacterized protein LOC108080284 [Drosophila kikkawai]
MIPEANIELLEADLVPPFMEENGFIVPVEESNLMGPMTLAQVYEYLDNATNDDLEEYFSMEELVTDEDTQDEYDYIEELDTDEEDPLEDEFHFSFIDWLLMLYNAIFQ